MLCMSTAVQLLATGPLQVLPVSSLQIPAVALGLYVVQVVQERWLSAWSESLGYPRFKKKKKSLGLANGAVRRDAHAVTYELLNVRKVLSNRNAMCLVYK